MQVSDDVPVDQVVVILVVPTNLVNRRCKRRRIGITTRVVPVAGRRRIGVVRSRCGRANHPDTQRNLPV